MDEPILYFHLQLAKLEDPGKLQPLSKQNECTYPKGLKFENQISDPTVGSVSQVTVIYTKKVTFTQKCDVVGDGC